MNSLDRLFVRAFAWATLGPIALYASWIAGTCVGIVLRHYVQL